LSTGGNPYNIAKVGANQVSLVGVSPIDANLGNIDIKEGTFAIQTTTAQVGDPSKTITVWTYATLNLYNLNASPLNKQIVMQDASTIFAESGRSIVNGPVTLQGTETINVGNVSTTPTLTFSNTLSGPGNLNKIGQGTLLLNGACSYLGGTTNTGFGTLIVNGTLGGDVLSSQQGSLAGNGTISPLADIFGGLLSGNVGGAGTLTAAGGLILESGAVITNDLSSTTTIGAGSNDLLEVTGNLTVNGNAIVVNLLGTALQSGGTYRLIDYTGNLIGSFDTTIQQTMPTRYTFTLDQATPEQVNLSVAGNPANLTWAAAVGNDAWDVANSQNWVLPGAVPAQFFQLDNVLLDDTASVSSTVTIAPGVAVQPTAITNTSSAGGNNFTITGAGKITGAASIVKRGSSTLTLSTTNDFTGPVTVEAGILRFGVTNSLGSAAGATTVAGGATLDVGSPILGVNQVNLNQEQIFVSGSGVGGNGAIINGSTNDQENATHFVTLLGDTTFGGPGNWAATNRPGRWDIRGLSNTDIATNTSAFLSTSNQPYNLTKVGSNWVAIVGVAVDPNLANINVLGGLLSIEHASTMGDPAKTLTVTNGAALEFYANGISNQLNKVLVLYGDGVNTNVINGNGTNVFVGPVTLHDNCVFHIAATSLLLSGVVAGDANCALTKYGPNTLYLSGANTYSGATLVNAGILGLTNSGTIDNSVAINVAAGATLDARGRADNALTLTSGQTLRGNGTIGGRLVVGSHATLAPGGTGPLTVSSNVTLLGTTSLQLDASTPTNDLIRCTATSGVITYGGTLDLVNVAIPLTTAHKFKLFSATNYAGAFAAITPPTPGTGLVWNTNTLAIDGTLRITNSVNLTPVNMTVVVTGSQLQLSWPTDHLGWDLQTNSVNVADPSLWFTLPGSASATQINISLDPLQTNVFYRMHYLKP
jgi:autotransporter-associated beta strand protein